MIGQRIRKAAGSVREESLSLLKSLVDVNSHSANAEGVNRVGDLVIKRLPGILNHHFISDTDGVRHHIVSTPAAVDRCILLLGHLDTVYPKVSVSRSFEKVNTRIVGPGTADMKGGIVVMVHALRLLDLLGCLDRIPLRCIFNGDEETGSVFSSGLLKELAPEASWGLVFECGGLNGEVVNRRRGVNRYELTVKGQARHSGVKEGPKVSALVEMARQVLALEDLNDPVRGVALNVGKAVGGTASNIVPDHASAIFEIRFWDKEAERDTVDRIAKITSRSLTKGCCVSVREIHRTPCMIPTSGTGDLLKTVKAVAEELGQTVEVERRGGASDGNLLSAMGVPVVDGLGPSGDLDHSPDEYIIEQSLHDRIELTALLLCRLGGIE